MESARSEPDIGKRQMFPLSSKNTVRGWQSPTHSPKLTANFRSEFNPSGSEGVLDHSPCVSPEDVDTNKQERVSKSDISSVSPSSERKEKIANRIWQMEYWRLEL